MASSTVTRLCGIRMTFSWISISRSSWRSSVSWRRSVTENSNQTMMVTGSTHRAFQKSRKKIPPNQMKNLVNESPRPLRSPTLEMMSSKNSDATSSSVKSSSSVTQRYSLGAASELRKRKEMTLASSSTERLEAALVSHEWPPAQKTERMSLSSLSVDHQLLRIFFLSLMDSFISSSKRTNVLWCAWSRFDDEVNDLSAKMEVRTAAVERREPVEVVEAVVERQSTPPVDRPPPCEADRSRLRLRGRKDDGRCRRSLPRSLLR
mmetsp:Transcript_10051/g.26190  ORF Transcript_10051/g.26190 Transcript_10051/m.26190 type:complete len:263 (+) Transcript_10051:1910-2698(+)